MIQLNVLKIVEPSFVYGRTNLCGIGGLVNRGMCGTPYSEIGGPRSAEFPVVEERLRQELPSNKSGVLKEEHIHIKYKEDGNTKTQCLRKVTYRDDKGRIFEFITNNFEISNQEVAFLYKLRWNIELLFKKLKRNFQLHYFYSEAENGIKTQIWCTLIAQLLLMLLRVKSASKKVFSTIAALIKIHLISYLDIFWMIENSRRTYSKRKTRNKSQVIQTSMF